ncbi:MAG: YiiD C-terminal domain-containing protein [Deltaproteobacteria bacterium]|nr:YiiD C-terminal domain-containing protein [Deltaproteobacteria bacterium]
MFLDYDVLKKIVLGIVPWVTMSDVDVEILEERHVRLVLPVKKKHLNHVGIVYAGSHFMLMELAGGALFAVTYGLNNFVPINKGMTINYHKPAITDLVCDLTLGKEQAENMIKTITANGKGDWILDMSVTDHAGNTVSSSTCNYYIIPSPEGFVKNLMKHN